MFCPQCRVEYRPGFTHRYFDQPLGSYPGVRRSDPFPVQPLARFGYQVAVLSSDLGRARQILGRLLEEPQDMELPLEDEERSEKAAATVTKEEDLTCELWSGSDERVADFVESALKENAIQMRREQRGRELSIYVPPGEEAAAREMVHEIVEGSPPNAGEKK